MWNRSVLLFLCLFVIGYLKRIRAEPKSCSSVHAFNTDLKSEKYKICKLLDETIDPCHDFYKFACGNYVSQSQIYQVASTSSDAQKANEIFLFKVLQLYSNNEYEDASYEINLAKNLYKSCTLVGVPVTNRQRLEKNALDSRSIGSMLEIIKVFGGMPAQGHDWKYEHYVGLYELLRNVFEISPIISIPLSQKGHDIILEVPKFTMGTTALLKNIDSYIGLMNTLVNKFAAYSEDELRAVLDFELELLNNSAISAMIDKISIYDFTTQLPQLNNIVQSIVPIDHKTDGAAQVIYLHSEYVERLDKVLKRTKPKIVAGYLLFHIGMAASKYMSFDTIRRVDEVINQDEPKPSATDKRDIQCFHYVLKLLPSTLDSIYIREKGMEPDKIRYIRNMANIIKDAFIEMVDKSDWMDEGAKNRTIIKLLNINFFIGSPNPLERFNYNIKLRPDNFLFNYLTIKKYNYDHPYPYYKGSRHNLATSWLVTPEYRDHDNSIYIPYGILQWPFFDFAAPDYANFGGLGSAIGHCIGHAIDPWSYKWFLHGINSNWYDSTVDQFKMKIECIRKQYAEVIIEPRHLELNTHKTIEEDFSDNVGLRAAFNAMPFLEQTDIFNYTQQQVFFISMAQTHCGHTDSSLKQEAVLHGPHTLYPYRVFGMIRNMPIFTKIFNCDRNAEMHFEKFLVCEVW